MEIVSQCVHAFGRHYNRDAAADFIRAGTRRGKGHQARDGEDQDDQNLLQHGGFPLGLTMIGMACRMAFLRRTIPP